MFDKIDSIIKQRNLKPADCGYHTLRILDNNGKVRALVVKGETVLHVELVCPKCGNYEYRQQEWKPGSKSAKSKFDAACSRCGNIVKIEKLKGKKA